MTRKLGRLLVVALVVAAVVAPMSVASADIGEHLACAGIDYDPDNPYHIVYPDLDFHIRFFADQWDLWYARHWGAPMPTTTEPYLVFNMQEISDVLGAPPAGESYVFFWNDLVYGVGSWSPGIPFRLVGTPYDDVICGSPTEDVIRGLAGNDTIIGGSLVPSAMGADDDVLQGGPGNDILIGGRGGDALTGNGGDDTVFAFVPAAAAWEFSGPYPFDLGSHNEIVGGPGNDTIYPSQSVDMDGDGVPDITPPSNGDIAWGGAGNDTFLGGDKQDYLFGQGGNDTMVGGSADDYLWGGVGDDEIWGGPGMDDIQGKAGNDKLYASSPADFAQTDPAKWDLTGSDTIVGQRGDDHIWGTHVVPAAWIDGGLGNDMIYIGSSGTIPGTVFGGVGADTMTGGAGVDYLYGGPDNDTILGGKGADYLYAGAGDDLVYGGDELAGTPPVDIPGDHIWGGPGYDDIFGGAGHDFIYGDDGEVPATTDGADWISGGSGDDEMHGTNGADVIYGEAGKDRVIGGDGADDLYGGEGDDTLFNNLSECPSLDQDNDEMFGGAGSDFYFGGGALEDSATELPADAGTDHVYGGILAVYGFTIPPDQIENTCP